jgi:hypothetical protein
MPRKKVVDVPRKKALAKSIFPEGHPTPGKFDCQELAEYLAIDTLKVLKKHDALKVPDNLRLRLIRESALSVLVEYVALAEPDPRE